MTKRPTSVVMVGREKGAKGKGRKVVVVGEGEGKKEGGAGAEAEEEEDWDEVYRELVRAVVKAGRAVKV